MQFSWFSANEQSAGEFFIAASRRKINHLLFRSFQLLLKATPKGRLCHIYKYSGRYRLD